MKKNIKKALILFAVTIFVISGVGIGVNHYREISETVQVISERVLVPGGQSIGIKMNVKGVLVVGLEEIETSRNILSPGYSAGLQIGDTITEINGKPVHYAKDVTAIVNEAKDKPLKMTVLRKDEKHDITVTPVKSHDTGDYKIGLWVKEKIAGIGTLTFYDPKTNVFAALGHGIYESKTGALLEAGKGELLKTEVRSIKEGEIGKPGEIRGIFYGNEKPIGEVKKNSPYGIYCKGRDFENFVLAQPMVMGYKDQVKVGDAYILTTINGSNVEKFDIRITKVNRQSEVDSKGMEIEVTDSRLLAYSGGIVQGMSGSPIIQDNRLIGAVTHVFVNNPTKGYGIFAEWMVKEGEKI